HSTTHSTSNTSNTSHHNPQPLTPALPTLDTGLKLPNEPTKSTLLSTDNDRHQPQNTNLSSPPELNPLRIDKNINNQNDPSADSKRDIASHINPTISRDPPGHIHNPPGMDFNPVNTGIPMTDKGYVTGNPSNNRG